MTIRAKDLQMLVDQYGEELTLVSKSFGSYNPATGSNTETTEETNFIGYQASFNLEELDGVTVIRGDRKVILGNSDIDGDPIKPEVDDEIEGIGDTVTIVSVSKIMSNGIVICYICQVRE